jgi:hypothetical protein
MISALESVVEFVRVLSLIYAAASAGVILVSPFHIFIIAFMAFTA